MSIRLWNEMITSKLSCTFTSLYPLSIAFIPPWAYTWIVLCPVAHVLMTNISYCISHAAIDGGNFFSVLFCISHCFLPQFPALCRLVLLPAGPCRALSPAKTWQRDSFWEGWRAQRSGTTKVDPLCWRQQVGWREPRWDQTLGVVCWVSVWILLNLRSYNLPGYYYYYYYCQK